MTISQWFHSVWFVAPCVIFTIWSIIHKIVDRYFVVTFSVKRRVRVRPPAEPSIVDDAFLRGFLGDDKVWDS